MTILKLPQLLPALVLVSGLAGLCALTAADEPAKTRSLVIIDAADKEQKITNYKIVAGTRRLSWLAPAPAPGGEEKAPPAEEKKGKAPPKAAKLRPGVGPEALEFRDEHSTNFVDGILTLIPLKNIRSIDYDNDKQTVTVKVISAEKGAADEILTGATKFRGINKLTIEAEVDKGDMGIAELKFQGGVPKGIHALSFPVPRAPAAMPAGRPATVTIADKEKGVQKVVDLLPLYRFNDGNEKLQPMVMFKKTLKVDLAKVAKIHVPEGNKPDEIEWQVTYKGTEEQTLSLLRNITLDDRPAYLEGFVGRVPAGWKLFPVHTIGEIVFDEAKGE